MKSFCILLALGLVVLSVVLSAAYAADGNEGIAVIAAAFALAAGYFPALLGCFLFGMVSALLFGTAGLPFFSGEHPVAGFAAFLCALTTGNLLLYAKMRARKDGEAAFRAKVKDAHDRGA